MDEVCFYKHGGDYYSSLLTKEPSPMKRQSAAEQALAKQSRWVLDRVAMLKQELEKLQSEIDATQLFHNQLQEEIVKLKSAREAASVRNKP